jgi:diacylglycerol O-acyltransferase
MTVSADLSTIQVTARRYGATVNDVMLAAVSRALHLLLAERGEHVSDFVISVPFSSRKEAGHQQLGNQSGVIPLLIPATGPFSQRVTAISGITSRAKRSQRGASTAALAPAFRLLATIGLYQRFIDHQHLIHTFVSDLSGPSTPLSLFGCPISAVIPLSFGIGNVTVSFTVLSYAGNLTVTVNADPATCPDLGRLCSLLDQELSPAEAEADPPRTSTVAWPVKHVGRLAGVDLP